MIRRHKEDSSEGKEIYAEVQIIAVLGEVEARAEAPGLCRRTG